MKKDDEHHHILQPMSYTNLLNDFCLFFFCNEKLNEMKFFHFQRKWQKKKHRQRYYLSLSLSLFHSFNGQNQISWPMMMMMMVMYSGDSNTHWFDIFKHIIKKKSFIYRRHSCWECITLKIMYWRNGTYAKSIHTQKNKNIRKTRGFGW